MPKQEYTAEFKEQAVKHAQAAGIVVAAKEPRRPDSSQLASSKPGAVQSMPRSGRAQAGSLTCS